MVCETLSGAQGVNEYCFAISGLGKKKKYSLEATSETSVRLKTGQKLFTFLQIRKVCGSSRGDLIRDASQRTIKPKTNKTPKPLSLNCKYLNPDLGICKNPSAV